MKIIKMEKINMRIKTLIGIGAGILLTGGTVLKTANYLNIKKNKPEPFL
jgi:hypothetical protein